MIAAYKFLGTGAVGLYSGFRWPTPGSTGPGAWIEAEGTLELGSNGVHACTPDELVHWIDDELWLVELAGPVEEHEGVFLAGRRRLLRRVEGWNAVMARAFAETCVMRARDTAVDVLRRLGDRHGALALAGVGDLHALGARAAAAARRSDGLAADALAYVADGVELAHGGRPERYGFHPAASARPSPGAIAANLGFVVAHAVGCAQAGAADNPAAYAAGVDAERARQRSWLVERLELDRVPA